MDGALASFSDVEGLKFYYIAVEIAAACRLAVPIVFPSIRNEALCWLRMTIRTFTAHRYVPSCYLLKLMSVELGIN